LKFNPGAHRHREPGSGAAAGEGPGRGHPDAGPLDRRHPHRSQRRGGTPLSGRRRCRGGWKRPWTRRERGRW